METFSKDLINWYINNKRSLPWREHKNPYEIWISEIMLQQTQVATVIDYFNRFLSLFPTVFDLASAPLESVLKTWEGLGYYSRAKNIHETSKTIVSRYNGVFPTDYETLLTLKGIGTYTAGAITSIAYQLPTPAVDGNVCRVMSRILCLYDDISSEKTKRKIHDLVKEIIPEDDPSSFNQGLMELGALVCKPKEPSCLTCPVKSHCIAYKDNVVTGLPVKLKKVKKVSHQMITAIIFNKNYEILMRKRTESLLEGMYEFIQVEGNHFNDIVQCLLRMNIEVSIGEYLGEVTHMFTHKIWNMEIYQSSILSMEELPDHYILVSKEDLNKYPISTAHKKVAVFLNNMLIRKIGLEGSFI